MEESMRVLLLQAPVTAWNPHAFHSPPLGLAYVAAALMRDGNAVELIDLNLSRPNPSRLQARLRRFRPQLVGISSHTETYPNALALARAVKEFDPHIPVVLGGPHPSIVREGALAEPDVDFIAVGEGEVTAVELARALSAGRAPEDLGAIRGLGHKAHGTPVLNAPREPLDAAMIGRPARELLSLDMYENAFSVLTSRGGCPYRCPFCSSSQIWGGRRRMRPVDDIIAEIDSLMTTYGPRQVFFVDDILTLNRRWLRQLLDALVAYEHPIEWGCATRIDSVDEELLSSMSRAGCRGIQFGVESGAQRILDSVKGIDKKTVLDVVRWTVASGMTASCSFMLPFPEDTEETLAETGAFMGEVQRAGGRLLISYTTPFPGTAFHERAEELGLRIITRDLSTYDCQHLVMDTRHLTRERVLAFAEELASGLGMVRTA